MVAAKSEEKGARSLSGEEKHCLWGDLLLLPFPDLALELIEGEDTTDRSVERLPAVREWVLSAGGSSARSYGNGPPRRVSNFCTCRACVDVSS